MVGKLRTVYETTYMKIGLVVANVEDGVILDGHLEKELFCDRVFNRKPVAQERYLPKGMSLAFEQIAYQRALAAGVNPVHVGRIGIVT